MTTTDIRRFGLIQAIIIETEGMKASNEIRRIQGSDILNYNEQNFDDQVKKIEKVLNFTDYEIELMFPSEPIRKAWPH